MDLDQAIERHLNWRTRFRIAINKREALDAAEIARDDCCELGLWLHGTGKAQLENLPDYGDCVRTHAEFHREAAAVARSINAQQFAEAEAMLKNGSPYCTASEAIGVAVVRLRRAAGL